MSLIQDIIRGYLPNQNIGPNGWISFNCPLCHLQGQPRPDTRSRGGIMFPDDNCIRYSCFNCHLKTGWDSGTLFSVQFKKLLSALMPHEQLMRLSLLVLKENEAARTITPVAQQRKLFVPDWKEVALPEASAPLQECLHDARAVKVAEYLHSRKLLGSADWHWSSSKDFELYNRALLPLTYKNKIVGWHARLAYDPVLKPRKKIIKKHDTGYMFGLDAQTADRKYVILVEGEYDALAISGVSTGTNSISQNQADVIERLQKTVIVVPDRDSSGRELEASAIKYGWDVSYPRWDSGIKDTAQAVATYGKLFVLKNIIENRESNKIKLKVLGKYYYNE